MEWIIPIFLLLKLKFKGVKVAWLILNSTFLILYISIQEETYTQQAVLESLVVTWVPDAQKVLLVKCSSLLFFPLAILSSLSHQGFLMWLSNNLMHP